MNRREGAPVVAAIARAVISPPDSPANGSFFVLSGCSEDGREPAAAVSSPD